MRVVPGSIKLRAKSNFAASWTVSCYMCTVVGSVPVLQHWGKHREIIAIVRYTSLSSFLPSFLPSILQISSVQIDTIPLTTSYWDLAFCARLGGVGVITEGQNECEATSHSMASPGLNWAASQIKLCVCVCVCMWVCLVYVWVSVCVRVGGRETERETSPISFETLPTTWHIPGCFNLGGVVATTIFKVFYF